MRTVQNKAGPTQVKSSQIRVGAPLLLIAEVLLDLLSIAVMAPSPAAVAPVRLTNPLEARGTLLELALALQLSDGLLDATAL